MRWLKIAWKVKKILLLIGATVFLLSVLRTAFAHFYHEKIRQLAIEELDEQLTTPFSFSEIDISFIRNFPNVTGSFDNLTVIGSDYFHNDTIAYAKEVHFELDLIKLIWDDQFEIESFHLNTPRIKLIELEDKTNFNIFGDSSTSDSSDFNIQLNEISIEHGDIQYTSKKTGYTIHCYDVNYSGKAKLEGNRYELASNIIFENFRMLSGKKKILDGNKIGGDLKMTYEVDQQKLSFTECFLALDRFNLVWSGDIAFQEDGIHSNLTFESDRTAFRDLFTLYPTIMKEDMKHITAAGDFKLAGTLQGLLADDYSRIPNFDIEMKVTDGKFKIDTLALPVQDIDIDLELKNTTGKWVDTKIDLKAFHADLGKFPLRGRFKMEGFNNPKIDTDIVSKIQLEDLEKIFPIDDIKMKGILGFELRAKGVWSHKFMGKNNSANESVPPFNLFFQLDNGSFKYVDLNESFDRAQFKLTAINTTGLPEDTELQLSELQMFLNDSPIQGELFLKNLTKPMIKSSFNADIDMGTLKDLFPMQGYETMGKLSLKVKAEGIYDQTENRFPAMDAKLNMVNGFLKSPDHSEPIQSIDLSAEFINQTGFFTDSKLKINHSDFLFEDEHVSMKGTVFDFKDYTYDLFFDGKVNLGRITKVYPVPQISLKGIVDAHVELKGSLPSIQQRAYEKLQANGKIEVTNLEIRSKAFLQTIIVDDAIVDITPGKIILKKFLGRAGKSSLQMLGDIHHYMSLMASDNELVKADLFIKVDTLDLGLLLAEQAHISDTTKTKVAPWIIPKNLDFRLDVSAKSIKHPELSVTRFDGNVLIREGVLKLKRANFTLEDGRFHMEGDYNPHVGPHPFFDFTIAIQDLDIHRAYEKCKLIHEMAPAIEHTEGIFSGDYFIKGYLGDNLIPMTETIEGKGEIRIANAKVNGMKMFERISKAAKKDGINDPHLKDLVIKTEIKNDHLIVKPFSMKLSGFNTDIEGIHDFNGILNYIVRIELLPIEKLKIPFHVSGPYDDPKVALGKGHALPEE